MRSAMVRTRLWRRAFISLIISFGLILTETQGIEASTSTTEIAPAVSSGLDAGAISGITISAIFLVIIVLLIILVKTDTIPKNKDNWSNLLRTGSYTLKPTGIISPVFSGEKEITDPIGVYSEITIHNGSATANPADKKIEDHKVNISNHTNDIYAVVNKPKKLTEEKNHLSLVLFSPGNTPKIIVPGIDTNEPIFGAVSFRRNRKPKIVQNDNDNSNAVDKPMHDIQQCETEEDTAYVNYTEWPNAIPNPAGDMEYVNNTELQNAIPNPSGDTEYVNNTELPNAIPNPSGYGVYESFESSNIDDACDDVSENEKITGEPREMGVPTYVYMNFSKDSDDPVDDTLGQTIYVELDKRKLSFSKIRSIPEENEPTVYTTIDFK